MLLNHMKTPGFLAPGGEEFNPGPEMRLDCSELLCYKVLLKYNLDYVSQGFIISISNNWKKRLFLFTLFQSVLCLFLKLKEQMNPVIYSKMHNIMKGYC